MSTILPALRSLPQGGLTGRHNSTRLKLSRLSDSCQQAALRCRSGRAQNGLHSPPLDHLLTYALTYICSGSAHAKPTPAGLSGALARMPPVFVAMLQWSRFDSGYSAGQSQAAPRTPDESPCAARRIGVSKVSENT